MSRQQKLSTPRLQKHIREAFRIAGITPDSIEVKNGHYKMIVNGHLVTAAGSPKNPDHTAINIARDLRIAAGVKK